MKKLFIISLIFISCNKQEKKVQVLENIPLHDYHVQLAFSSFFENGVFEKYILDNCFDENEYSVKLNANIIYKIEYHDGKSDTSIIKISKDQSDSIFNLSKSIIEDSKFTYQKYKKGDTIPLVRDGESMELEIKQGNTTKSIHRYRIADLKDISINFTELYKRIRNTNKQ